MTKKFKQLALLGGDIIILYFSLYLTLFLRYLEKPSPELLQSHFLPFSIVFFFWLLIFYISDLYNLNFAVNNIRFFQLTGRSLAISSFLSIAFFYLIPQITIAPKRNMLIYVIVFALLFMIWRQLYNWFLRAYLPKNNIAVIGLNSQVRELIKELQKKPHLGYVISYIIDDRENSQNETGNIPILKNFHNLKQLIADKKINTIVLTADPHQSAELRTSLFNCLPLGITFVGLPDFYEAITGKIPLDAINQMWFLEKLSEGRKVWFDAIKRGYDLTLASLILLISIVFWPLIALLVKISSPGPVFFRQMRTGKNGKPFSIIKFRTMTVSNNDLSPTKSNDVRITKMGSYLRKSRIDELPQIINILKGEMSFVGPRPERPELISNLEEQIPFYRERMLVKPGATGWDQISGEYHSPSREDSIKKLQYDLFYIKNRSIYLDLSIILKTIATILSRKGV